MALETGSYISDLVATNPPGGDDVGQADDHIRLIKQVIKNSFPNINGPMLASDNILSVLAVDVNLPGGDGYALTYDQVNATVKWSLISGGAGETVPAHTHNAVDINAGTMDIARLPTGTGVDTVALGNHTHTKISNALWITGEVTSGASQQAGFGWASAASVAYVSSKVVNGDAALLTWTGSANYAPVVADGATHGAILSHAGATKLATTSTGISVTGQLTTTGNFTSGGSVALSGGIQPSVNGAYDCASGFARWGTVYSVNPANVSSDARLKKDIVPLSPEELEASRRLAKMIRRWHWREGDDKHHIGLIAQDIVACMKQVGLNAEDYAFVSLHDAVDENGNAVQRYGVYYSQLAMFIAAGQEQRIDALERALMDK